MQPEYSLTSFSINNFRIFEKKASFNFLPLTILTGANSSGKSSLTKALQLLTRSYLKNGLRRLELMETELKLGSFNDILNYACKKNPVSFNFSLREIQDNGGGGGCNK